MLNNYVVRCTLTIDGRLAPVVTYVRYEGYPRIELRKSLQGASFFGDLSNPYNEADRLNAVKHMNLLVTEGAAPNPSFKAKVKELADGATGVIYTLDCMQFTGESLEKFKINSVATCKGVL